MGTVVLKAVNIKTRIKRPLLHYVIIIGYVLAPVVNIVLLRIAADISFLTIFQRLFRGYGYLAGIWLLTAPLIGIGLYFVSRISWYAFLVHSSLILIDYILKWVIRPAFYWQTIPTIHHFLIFTGNLLLVGVIGYIIQKDFRSPYFQVLKRTWRESERVPINNQILANQMQKRITDISEGGCFIPDPDLGLTAGDKIDLVFKSYTLDVECQGEIMRHSTEGYGIRFISLPPEKKRDIRRLVKKRHFLRYEVEFSGSWKHAGKIEKIKILDISSGGCYVHTEVDDLTAGTGGEVGIEIIDRSFSTPGKAVWLNKSGLQDRPVGFGFKFSRKQRRIVHHIISHMGKLKQSR